MTNTSEIIAEKLLSLSRKFGSEHADVLITKGRNNSVEVRERELEQIEGSDSLRSNKSFWLAALFSKIFFDFNIKFGIELNNENLF